jgi:hypothetical protein
MILVRMDAPEMLNRLCLSWAPPVRHAFAGHNTALLEKVVDTEARELFLP